MRSDASRASDGSSDAAVVCRAQSSAVALQSTPCTSSPALPVTTLKEFVAYLQKNPGRVSYGSAGPGSLTHLTMELFKQQVNSFMVHIPYRGIAPAFTDLIGGQTQAMFPGLAAAVPHIRSGRVRPLL